MTQINETSDGNQSYFLRKVEGYCPRVELICAESRTPFLDLLGLLGECRDNSYVHEAYSNALSYLSSMQKVQPQKDMGDFSLYSCLYCEGASDCIIAYDNNLQVDYVGIETSKKDHSRLYNLQHFALFVTWDNFTEDYAVFESLEEALNLDSHQETSRSPIAKPGIDGSWDGGTYWKTRWLETERDHIHFHDDTGDSFFLELGMFDDDEEVDIEWEARERDAQAIAQATPHNCGENKSIFVSGYAWDHLVAVYEVQKNDSPTDADLMEALNSDAPLDSILAWWEGKKEVQEGDYIKCWRSLAAPREDWMVLSLQWIGCSVCNKPIVKVKNFGLETDDLEQIIEAENFESDFLPQLLNELSFKVTTDEQISGLDRFFCDVFQYKGADFLRDYWTKLDNSVQTRLLGTQKMLNQESK